MAYKIETTLDHPRLLNLIESTKHKHFEDDTERKEMLKALHEAAEKIETPLEKTLRLTWYLVSRSGPQLRSLDMIKCSALTRQNAA